MSELTNVVSLVVGDRSGDGHDKRETTVLKSNLSGPEIMSAYQKATKKLGFDFITEVCAEYEDRTVPASKLKTLVEHGLVIEDTFADYEINICKDAVEAGDDDLSDGVSIWVDTYVEIFLFIIKLGNQDFEYEYAPDDTSHLDIGGYGLFE